MPVESALGSGVRPTWVQMPQQFCVRCSRDSLSMASWFVKRALSQMIAKTNEFMHNGDSPMPSIPTSFTQPYFPLGTSKATQTGSAECPDHWRMCWALRFGFSGKATGCGLCRYWQPPQYSFQWLILAVGRVGARSQEPGAVIPCSPPRA
jgi:hypothetical protein